MERQRVKFPWDLYWENKTYKLKRRILVTLPQNDIWIMLGENWCWSLLELSVALVNKLCRFSECPSSAFIIPHSTNYGRKWVETYDAKIFGIIWLDKCWLWLVNGCLGYSRPIITKAAPPKRPQQSLNPKLVPIPLRVSEDDNFDLPLTKVHEVGEKGGILFHFSSFSSRVCLAHSRVTGTPARQFWTQLFEDQLALTRARG